MKTLIKISVNLTLRLVRGKARLPVPNVLLRPPCNNKYVQFIAKLLNFILLSYKRSRKMSKTTLDNASTNNTKPWLSNNQLYTIQVKGHNMFTTDFSEVR